MDRNTILNETVDIMLGTYKHFTRDGKTSAKGVQAVTAIVQATPKELRADLLNRFEGKAKKEGLIDEA